MVCFSWFWECVDLIFRNFTFRKAVYARRGGVVTVALQPVCKLDKACTVLRVHVAMHIYVPKHSVVMQARNILVGFFKLTLVLGVENIFIKANALF